MNSIQNQLPPVFNEVLPPTNYPQDSLDSDKSRNKLCLCPLCKNGMEVFGKKRPVSWILILRTIIYSLMDLNKGTIYFSLKDEIHPFVEEHWKFFGELDQFNQTETRWKKAFLDGLSHSPFFQSGTSKFGKPNFWKLRRTDCPWIKQKRINMKEMDDEDDDNDNINQLLKTDKNEKEKHEKTDKNEKGKKGKKTKGGNGNLLSTNQTDNGVQQTNANGNQLSSQMNQIGTNGVFIASDTNLSNALPTLPNPIQHSNGLLQMKHQNGEYDSEFYVPTPTITPAAIGINPAYQMSQNGLSHQSITPSIQTGHVLHQSYTPTFPPITSRLNPPLNAHTPIPIHSHTPIGPLMTPIDPSMNSVNLPLTTSMNPTTMMNPVFHQSSTTPLGIPSMMASNPQIIPSQSPYCPLSSHTPIVTHQPHQSYQPMKQTPYQPTIPIHQSYSPYPSFQSPAPHQLHDQNHSFTQSNLPSIQNQQVQSSQLHPNNTTNGIIENNQSNGNINSDSNNNDTMDSISNNDIDNNDHNDTNNINDNIDNNDINEKNENNGITQHVQTAFTQRKGPNDRSDFLFTSSAATSPTPENGFVSRDQSKEYLVKTVANIKNQLDKCMNVCDQLGKDNSVSDNIKTIADQFKWIKNSLNVINANIDSTLF